MAMGDTMHDNEANPADDAAGTPATAPHATARSQAYPQLRDEAWLRTQRTERGRTLQDIAGEIGCSCSMVHDATVRLRVKPPPRREKYPEANGDAIRARLSQGRTPKEIAVEFGCSVTLLRHRMRLAGLKAPGTAAVKKKPLLHDEAYLRTRRAAGDTDTDIAREIGCSDVNVGRAMRRFRIARPGTRPGTRPGARPGQPPAAAPGTAPGG